MVGGVEGYNGQTQGIDGAPVPLCSPRPPGAPTQESCKIRSKCLLFNTSTGAQARSWGGHSQGGEGLGGTGPDPHGSGAGRERGGQRQEPALNQNNFINARRWRGPPCPPPGTAWSWVHPAPPLPPPGPPSCSSGGPPKAPNKLGATSGPRIRGAGWEGAGSTRRPRPLLQRGWEGASPHRSSSSHTRLTMIILLIAISIKLPQSTTRQTAASESPFPAPTKP